MARANVWSTLQAWGQGWMFWVVVFSIVVIGGIALGVIPAGAFERMFNGILGVIERIAPEVA